MPPECLVATRPAGAAPRPASRRLMIAPLSGRGACSAKRGLGGGDYAGIDSPVSSSRRKPGSRATDCRVGKASVPTVSFRVGNENVAHPTASGYRLG